MLTIAAQQLRWASLAFPPLGWQGFRSRFPNCHRGLHPYDVFESELGDRRAKLSVVAIASVGENNPTGHVRSDRLPNLIQCDLRLGLKASLLGHPCFLSPLGIFGPLLRQIQP